MGDAKLSIANKLFNLMKITYHYNNSDVNETWEKHSLSWKQAEIHGCIIDMYDEKQVNKHMDKFYDCKSDEQLELLFNSYPIEFQSDIYMYMFLHVCVFNASRYGFA